MHFKQQLLLFMILVLFLTGCQGNAQGTESQESEIEGAESQVTEESQATEETQVTEESEVLEPEVLRFVDAWDEWHEVEVLRDVKRHPYNWEYLTNDEATMSYTGDENFTYRLGIDVSKWQGKINWDKVKADGVEFVIIRLGYRGYGSKGTLDMDSRFYQNIKGAQAAGLDVGVYFFAQAINEKEAIEEAEYVLKALEGYELQLPIVYDPELIRDQDARTDNVTGEQFTKNTIAFCERIEEAGFDAMIYSNMVWEAFLFDMTKLQEYPFWYADYEPVPQTPYDFQIWQYSESGKVNGIDGPVDLNIMFEPIGQ